MEAGIVTPNSSEIAAFGSLNSLARKSASAAALPRMFVRISFGVFIGILSRRVKGAIRSRTETRERPTMPEEWPREPDSDSSCGPASIHSSPRNAPRAFLDATGVFRLRLYTDLQANRARGGLWARYGPVRRNPENPPAQSGSFRLVPASVPNVPPGNALQSFLGVMAGFLVQLSYRPSADRRPWRVPGRDGFMTTEMADNENMKAILLGAAAILAVVVILLAA